MVLSLTAGPVVVSSTVRSGVSSFFLFETISMTVSSLPDVDCDSLLALTGLPKVAWSAGEGTMSPPVRGLVPDPEVEAEG